MDLVVHPVRLRIIHALGGGRTVTTGELCERMPDVSSATVYRHVGLLVEGGLLEVESEERVRGTVERRYRLRRERAAIGAETAAEASVDDHRRVFAVAMTALIAEFNTYLDREDADPAADLVGYRQHALWLTHAELESFIKDLRKVILPRMKHKPSPKRSQHLLSPILFPIGGSPDEQDADDRHADQGA